MLGAEPRRPRNDVALLADDPLPVRLVEVSVGICAAIGDVRAGGDGPIGSEPGLVGAVEVVEEQDAGRWRCPRVRRAGIGSARIRNAGIGICATVGGSAIGGSAIGGSAVGLTAAGSSAEC